MPKMLQVRNLPDAVHAELVRRARSSGHTLTGYVEEILLRETSRPPVEEVLARIRDRRPVDLGARAAELLRSERAERDS